MKVLDRRISVAPMMDWTDRHCRFFHRLHSPHSLLYTEMIVAAAIVRGNAARLLDHDAAEHPLALQLGGCDPVELAQAARLGAEAGYAEINLNVGCPSDRVKNGSFGACLMLRPSLVAESVMRMRDAVRVPVTVKCRIGIDDRDDYDFFAGFADAVIGAGADALIVHARAAILGGLSARADGAVSGAPGLVSRRALSPKENREIPPLKYDYVYRLKRERPGLAVVLNGGLEDRLQAVRQLHEGLDGVMLGRAVYHRPALLAELENAVIDPGWAPPALGQIIESMVAYAETQRARGVRLHSVTRHMHGIIAGRDGARAWRRFLSQIACCPDAEPKMLLSALPMLNQGLAA